MPCSLGGTLANAGDVIWTLELEVDTNRTHKYQSILQEQLYPFKYRKNYIMS